MSRIAQEMQRQADEMRLTRKRSAASSRGQEYDRAGAAARVAVKRQARRTDVPFGDETIGKGPDTGSPPVTDVTEQLLPDPPAAQTVEAGGDDDMAKKKATGKVKRARKVTKAAPKPRTPRAQGVMMTKETPLDPLAGVRKNPKNKVLFINRDAALALVHRLLKDAVGGGKLTDAERFEADRLLARIDARA